MTRVGIVGLGSIAGAHVAALRHLAAEGWDIEIAGWAGRPESAAALGLLDLPEARRPRRRSARPSATLFLRRACGGRTVAGDRVRTTAGP